MDEVAISVGLAGDGDEISAIYDVENAFNIKFDYDYVRNWITAGDLFASLKKTLSDSELAEIGLWDRFAIALCQETGVDPKALKPESLLILEGHSWRRIHDALSWLWVIGFALIALLGVAAYILS
ncbi:hypothetical protein [Qipengyuania marisflavi]|uniref:Uncharacterized protein n=1 Tax=Qipengyuania marisflavi TaxID=2486356 RepID=A0A5S3P001_9SPHN|nr:hypothetical protein [Qipengyuania marisflavi]TMM45849.1 hypothetical protein FEV51_12220 [Qipengyuania marisflavi]